MAQGSLHPNRFHWSLRHVLHYYFKLQSSSILAKTLRPVVKIMTPGAALSQSPEVPVPTCAKRFSPMTSCIWFAFGSWNFCLPPGRSEGRATSHWILRLPQSEPATRREKNESVKSPKVQKSMHKNARNLLSGQVMIERGTIDVAMLVWRMARSCLNKHANVPIHLRLLRFELRYVGFCEVRPHWLSVLCATSKDQLQVLAPN